MFDTKFTSNSFDNGESSLYDILDVKPEASPAEIRDSYLRIKNTYSKDSVALYTLIDPGEREDILKKIEQAYTILSNPVTRREYDQSFNSSLTSPWFDSNASQNSGSPSSLSSSLSSSAANVVSIDRVPPMEDVENAERALVAPVTDFGFKSLNPPAFPESPKTKTPSASAKTDPSSFASAQQSQQQPQQQPLINPLPTPVVSDIEAEIQAENEWSGPFIRKVREARGISVEEIIQATRITRAYVLAIEEENLAKLPAPVYVRGFVNQISRILRVSDKDVAAAYMRRCQRLHPEKFR